MEYAISKTVNLSYSEAIEKVTAELKNEGFGVLTTIDVKETLKKKIDADIEPYVILGACNPPLAKQALEARPDIGLFLPCNVIVYQKQNGEVVVAAFNPEIMEKVVPDNSELKAVADEVKGRLDRVIQAL